MENIRCNRDEMTALGKTKADESYRVEYEGIHLISADPSLLLNAHGLAPATLEYLSQAAHDKVRVNVFPASSSICRA